MPAASASEILHDGISLLEIPEAPRVERALQAYLGELVKWNPRFGFVKVDSEEELVVKHVLDSLSAWRIVRDEAKGGSVLDVGSGCGFPGIPLAIALPGASFTLLERSQNRASFLRTCKVLLGLARVEILQADLGSVSSAFDVVTFRAVAPLPRFFKDAARASLGFGSVVAYKGRSERAREEIEDVRRSTGGFLRSELVPVSVPFLDEERCVVIVRSSSLLTNR